MSGPYTCTSCTSSTWNDDDLCDSCVERARKDMEEAEKDDRMTHDTDALVSEVRALLDDPTQGYSTPLPMQQSHKAQYWEQYGPQLCDAIARLTRELGEARTESLTNFIAAGQAARLAETAEAALSAARAELEKKEGWVRVPIEVENACLNWLANRIQGNSHGEDVELGRLMSGLQTYIQAVADGTSK